MEKSELLYGDKVDSARVEQLAQSYAAEGRLCEAVDFYKRAGNADALRKLAEEAVVQGDAFLLIQAERALGEPVEPPRWRTLAQNALAAGKKAYAITAYRRAGDEEAAEQIENP